MPTPKMALEGIRVLDLGMFWAGPYAGKLLADLGAEVIKIEAIRRPDPLRVQARGLFPNGDPGERPWNRSGMINERNRNKYGITLDLTTPKGVAIFKELVKIGDIISENFSARVMEGFGLGYPVLREINPRIILVSISSQGLNGPDRDFVSYGNALEQSGGFTFLTGYPDVPPYFSSGNYPDAIAGIAAAGAALVALRQRRRTGQGVHVELSQREAVSHMLGEYVMDYSMNGRVGEPIGNRHRSKAPQGCYPCKDEDTWVTLSVGTDQEWATLCQVMGMPDLAGDPRFDHVLSRYQHHDELDAIITSWTQERTPREAMEALRTAGIAAGAVNTVPDMLADPHFQARGFFEVESHPESGTHPYYSRPMKLTKTPHIHRMPAPGFGEHNQYIYGTLLGRSQAEIAELEREGIIGTVPAALAAAEG
ncbi:MAG: CoA transferase [Chloroflexi bacterium]|nr:CoA transferase [Chloroflexota bacterium]